MLQFLLLLPILVAVATARVQTVGARGQLMCGNQPLAGATVKLWDLNTWPIPDDVIMEAYTDQNGNFEVYGTRDDTFKMDPAVKFYHRCNNRGTFNIPNLCKRKITYDIPKSYIHDGSAVGTWYEMGTTNMEAKQRNEATECFGKKK